MIKHTRKISSRLEASNFLQRVFDLFDAYVHSNILVHIETLSGQIVIDKMQIRDSFDFDFVRDVFVRNINNVEFICTVMVKRQSEH